jgi:hypothetical protein
MAKKVTPKATVPVKIKFNIQQGLGVYNLVSFALLVFHFPDIEAEIPKKLVLQR